VGVFDLFETLVDYDDRRSRVQRRAGPAHGAGAGRVPPALLRGPAGTGDRADGPYLDSLGIDEETIHEFLELRRSFTREILGSPRAGVVETLRELRGLGTGLITVRSDASVDVWEETPFAGSPV
jgi:FMN phosphatase YigB (HAD superfamily)